MLRGGKVKELYELKGEGRSIRGIARELGMSRNTVRKYARSPEVPKPKQRSRRGSKLDAYKECTDGRMSDGLENRVVLLREIRELGYEGGYTTLKDTTRSPVAVPDSPGRQCGSRPVPVNRRRWTGEYSAISERMDASAGCGRS